MMTVAARMKISAIFDVLVYNKNRTMSSENNITEPLSERKVSVKVKSSTAWYRRKREQETGVKWEDMDHKRGRKRVNADQPTYHMRRYRASMLAFKEHISNCNRIPCEICNAKPSH